MNVLASIPPLVFRFSFGLVCCTFFIYPVILFPCYALVQVYGDNRFTHVGKLLQRPRIDQLPQLIHVLWSGMYFVGSRPFVPDQEHDFLEIPYYRQQCRSKPRPRDGRKSTGATPLQWKTTQKENLSIDLDDLILFKTMKIVLSVWGSR
jgi:hypothetical protein